MVTVDDELMLNVLRCQLTYKGQVVTNAEAWFNKSRPRKPEGSLGRTAQDIHLESHTAPELCGDSVAIGIYIYTLPPPRNTPPPLQHVPTIGLRVSVDVKHHVYEERERGGGGEIIDVNN